MNPQDALLLKKLTIIAKKIIYDKSRMHTFMQMMGTKQGALQAVHTVMAVITQKMKVPEQLLVQLSVNIYLAIVDVAQEVTGAKASQEVVRDVVSQLINDVKGSKPMQPPQPSQPTSPQPQSQGIIGQRIGAMA